MTLTNIFANFRASTSQNYTVNSQPYHQFLSHLHEYPYTNTFSKSSLYERADLLKWFAELGLTQVCAYEDDKHYEIEFWTSDEMLILYTWQNPEYFSVEIACKAPKQSLEMTKALSERLVPIPVVENVVPVVFWNHSPHGPVERTKKLQTQPWDDIACNYPEEVRNNLADLLDVEEPDRHGKLILWHGVPGTGKTHAIRSLINRWSSWCDAHYIVDPDDFFVYSSYMMDTLLSGEGERWRLLILEDAGEFIVKEAKHKQGQQLSRLLNITDGLVGQGLKLLVLITTNEDINTVNDAVNRPGRCLANIGFDRFSHHEAAQWLQNFNVNMNEIKTPSNIDGYTLAELYNLYGEVEKITKEEPTYILPGYA